MSAGRCSRTPATNLASYASEIVCVDAGGSGTEAARGPGPQLSVLVASGADVVCTITNTFIEFTECADGRDNSEDVEDTAADYPADLGCAYPADHDEDGTGSLEVRKNLVPSTDRGRFDLQIDGITDPDASAIGHNGSTGREVLIAGEHSIGEVAAPGSRTNLALYAVSIDCRERTSGISILTPTVGAGPLIVPLRDESDVICTVTNTRLTATGRCRSRGHKPHRGRHGSHPRRG